MKYFWYVPLIREIFRYLKGRDFDGYTHPAIPAQFDGIYFGGSEKKWCELILVDTGDSVGGF